MSAITTTTTTTTASTSTYLETATEDLRKDIMAENLKARSAAKKSLQHIRACGEMLIELKARAGHGNFRFELNQLRIKSSTAANYMKVAANIQHVGHLGSGMRDALKLLTKGDAQIEESEESQLPPPAPRPSAPRPSPAAVTLEAEIVEPDHPVIEPEPQDDEPEPLVVDGTSDEIIEKENPWVTSRQAIAELAKLDGKISSPLGDVLAYIEKRWDLTFNLKVRK